MMKLSSRNLERREILIDTVEYYSAGNRRCAGFYMQGRKCCAIGRLVKLSKKGELAALVKWAETQSDFPGDISVGAARDAKILPPDVHRLGRAFLQDLQDLHDDCVYWGKSGLSLRGKKFYNDMQEKIAIKEYGK